jgi:UDP-N-acetyl-D-galactosamine dehydrogenase
LGITFKENCPDVRNTKVIDIIKHLQAYHIQVDVYDPWANPAAVADEYGIAILEQLPEGCYYDAVILAVAPKQIGYEMIKKMCNDKCVLFDVKSVLAKELVDVRL